MKILKITTYWTVEEAASACEFLDEIKNAILTAYRDEFEQYNQERYEELQQQNEKVEEDWCDDEIPF